MTAVGALRLVRSHAKDWVQEVPGQRFSVRQTCHLLAYISVFPDHDCRGNSAAWTKTSAVE